MLEEFIEKLNKSEVDHSQTKHEKQKLIEDYK